MKEKLENKKEINKYLIEIDFRERNKEFNTFIKYYISTNEDFNIFYLKETDLKIDKSDLKIGDCLINKALPIERKSKFDFLSSIYDGRLNNQCHKMYKVFGFGYVVVSDEISSYNEIQQKQILSVCASIFRDYKTPVMFCGSEEMAAYQTLAISLKFVKESNPKMILDIPKCLTIYQQKMGILSIFEGIRKKKSKALIEHFKQLRKIFNASKEELKEVYGIGNKIIDNIYEVLDNEDIEEKKIFKLEQNW